MVVARFGRWPVKEIPRSMRKLNSADAARLQDGLIARAVEDDLLMPILLYRTARFAGIRGRASMTSGELARALTAP
jgi:hypothetical protein